MTMSFQNEYQNNTRFSNFQLLAQSIVEGFISGIHKSPFHGFSAEFAEHKIYNNGESTRHIDWKLFAKTDKLYTKRFDEETNMRCHIIVDLSSSMYYPNRKEHSDLDYNKVEFSVLASAVLLQILKKQRDAAGLSLYAEDYQFYAPEKGNERHFQMLLNTLHDATKSVPNQSTTKTYEALHQIAEQLNRRSMIILFTDMFQSDVQSSQLFEALRHLKHNKHEFILFHVFDKKTEYDFDFSNTPKHFVDVETGVSIDVFPQSVQENYKIELTKYFGELKLKCEQYKISYVPADVREGFDKILMTFFEKRHKFL
jgi:uncharacterized protein (DUF58 family)